MQEGSSKPSASSAPEPDHRARLLAGMAAALTEKGYADITVADVVRRARVSKRTFYEHFADKEQCYLATYAALSDDLLAGIARAAAIPNLDPEERLATATHAYLAALEAQPELARTFLIEIQAAGPKALALRRKIHQRFADMLRIVIEQGRRDRDDVRPLSPEMAAALVGGINELLLLKIEAGRADKLTELQQTVVDLIRAVLTPPSAPTPSRKRRK